MPAIQRTGLTLLAALLVPILGGCDCGTPTRPDGGEEDAGDHLRSDAGDPDAGDPDAGEPDAGEPDAGEPDAGEVDAGIVVEQYCPTLAENRCARELSCGFLGPTELTTCAQRLGLACADDFRRVDAGTARFNLPAGEECLSALSSLRCIEGPFTVPAACAFHRVFEPAAQLGTHCEDDQDCVVGYCFGTSLQCRSCRAFAGLSQACSANDKRCDPSVQFCPQAVVPRTCATLLADGAPCNASSECAARWCNWKSQVPDAGVDLCGRLPLGAGCGDPDDCVSGAWCQGYAFDGVLVTAGVCAPRLPVGEACANTPDDDGCVKPASCLEGVCTIALPYSLDGGAECERLSECQEPLYCRDLEALQPDGGRSLRSGVCTPRLLAGAACSYSTYVDTDCGPSTTCGRGGTCVPRSAADAGCLARYECQDFLACPASTQRCTPFLTAGQPCELTGSVCLDSWCGASSADAGTSCLAKGAEGVSCTVTAPNQCASNRCFSSGSGPVCQPACFP